MPDEMLVMGILPAVIDHPGPTENVWCEAGKRNIPVCFLPKTVLPGTHQQAEMIDIKWERLDHQCGVCWYPDSNNRPDTYICGDCRCLMALCCCVSCLVTVVRSRLIEIDQFSDCRHTYKWGSGLLGNPMTLSDVICLYAKMNQKFKGGMENVMIEYNDTVDSSELQRCADGHHSALAHASAHDKPIREKGRFGYVDTPVPNADWLHRCAVLFVPVGDVRIGYIKSAVDRGQSTDAAPVTESYIRFFASTIIVLQDILEVGLSAIRCFKTCMLKNSCYGRGVLPVYRTMEGAALVDDRVGITFDIELCVPWDAPEAVVDINSADVVTLGSVPDKVGLFGCRTEAAASRILQGRDSRSVRFLVPDVRAWTRIFMT